MLLTLAVTVLAAAPTPITPIKVAALGFQVSDVPAARAEVLSDYFAQKFTESGRGRITVITRSQIATLLGFERQKVLLGCSTDGASCMAELSNALGADVVLTGTLGRIGTAWAINLKLVNAVNGHELSARSGHVGEEAALLGWLSEAARGMAPEVVRALRPGEEAELVAEGSDAPAAEAAVPLRSRAWIPAAGGVALVGAGAVFLVLAAGDAQKLQSPKPEYSADALAASGKTKQIAGDALVAAGLGALATAGLMYALGGPDDSAEGAEVAVIPSSSGGALVLSGRFP